MADNNKGVKTSLKNHLLKWRGRVKHKMTRVCETERFQKELGLYQQVVHWSEDEFFDKINDVVKQLEWHSSFYLPARSIA